MRHEQSPDFQVVCENVNGYIGVCSCCGEYNFAYKTILITFQEEEMLQFFDWLKEGQSNENDTSLRHGRNRIYSSPHGNLFLVFNDEELDEISALHSQLEIMLQAKQILSGRKSKF